ncbi:MAG: sialate O-acetylesterase [Planctomycetota bacterium]|nr:sialate O-acetylesterase [Planctomycetota bacterium]
MKSSSPSSSPANRILSAIALTLAAATALATFATSARADVKLPNIIGSNMVLQRDVELTLWGWADADEAVSVQLGQSTAKTTANAKGEWKLKLPAQPAGGPHTLTIKGKNTIELTNVLVGEVWLASGQSNMAMSVFRTSSRTKDDVASAKYPRIRLFNVTAKKIAHILPQSNVDPSLAWAECTPESATDFSAVAYYFGRCIHKELDVPVGLISASWGGTRIESWMPPEAFALSGDEAVKAIGEKQSKQVDAHLASLQKALAAHEEPPPSPANHLSPFANFNGNIHPLIPFPIRGLLWYQGESNLAEGLAYTRKMEGLIKSWRAAWGQGDLPFFYVQLAPYRVKVFGRGNQELPFVMPEMWESQAAVLRTVPNTGMAVTTDLGNLNDVHPVTKEEVGRRLSLWALAKVYGRKDLVFSGPLYKSMKIEGPKIRLEFDHAEEGLATRDGQPPNWFQIADDTGEFVDAEAKIDGPTLLVSSEKVPKPTAVRFGWSPIAEPNLVNKAMLPASPFRTGR